MNITEEGREQVASPEFRAKFRDFITNLTERKVRPPGDIPKSIKNPKLRKVLERLCDHTDRTYGRRYACNRALLRCCLLMEVIKVLHKNKRWLLDLGYETAQDAIAARAARAAKAAGGQPDRSVSKRAKRRARGTNERQAN